MTEEKKQIKNMKNKRFQELSTALKENMKRRREKKKLEKSLSQIDEKEKC